MREWRLAELDVRTVGTTHSSKHLRRVLTMGVAAISAGEVIFDIAAQGRKDSCRPRLDDVCALPSRSDDRLVGGLGPQTALR